MRALTFFMFSTMLLFPYANHAQFDGQVDPNMGRVLSERLKLDEQKYQYFNNHVNDLSVRRIFNQTYDYQILLSNIGHSKLILDQIKSEIYALQYDHATPNLAQLDNLLSAIKVIFDEDASISTLEFKRVSVLDEFYEPKSTLPTQKGPALRATIASEISFAARVLIKANVRGPFAGSPPQHAFNASPCSDAREQLVAKELDMENKFGYKDPGNFGGQNSYFVMANRELDILHYSIAHDLAYMAYIEGQKVLAICSSPDGNSNPASIVVTPNGQPVTTIKTNTIKKVSIAAGVANGLLIKKTSPDYPAIAQAARVSGTVILQVTISENGIIEGIQIISGPAMLQQAAIDAVRNWRYKPYLLDDEPVKVDTTVNVVFALPH